MKKLEFEDVTIYIEKIESLMSDFHGEKPLAGGGNSGENEFLSGGEIIGKNKPLSGREKEHLAGIRLLFKGVMEEYPELEGEGVFCDRIKKGNKGKPYFEGKNFPKFSISHSGEYVVCALSKFEVGCDIQIVEEGRYERVAKMAERFFTREEYQSIREAENPLDLFYRIWVIKESYIKATGEGLSRGLNTFQVDISRGLNTCQVDISRGLDTFQVESGKARGIRLIFDDRESENDDKIKLPRVTEFEIPGYKGAVCILR